MHSALTLARVCLCMYMYIEVFALRGMKLIARLPVMIWIHVKLLVVSCLLNVIPVFESLFFAPYQIGLEYATSTRISGSCWNWIKNYENNQNQISQGLCIWFL